MPQIQKAKFLAIFVSTVWFQTANIAHGWVVNSDHDPTNGSFSEDTMVQKTHDKKAVVFKKRIGHRFNIISLQNYDNYVLVLKICISGIQNVSRRQ